MSLCDECILIIQYIIHLFMIMCKKLKTSFFMHFIICIFILQSLQLLWTVQAQQNSGIWVDIHGQ